jgi:hypothetical protein
VEWTAWELGIRMQTTRPRVPNGVVPLPPVNYCITG